MFACRQPNQVENKTELLLKNLRLLGIGGPMEQEEREAAGFGTSGAGMPWENQDVLSGLL